MRAMTTRASTTGNYADINGLHVYYGRQGSGPPMVLLHGGLGSSDMFAPILPQLAEHHEVVTVDLQGHGRTADIDRPIDVRLMAGDICALIDQLDLGQTTWSVTRSAGASHSSPPGRALRRCAGWS